ncbi:rhodanese-like domain-containing protein [Spongiivirga citrea]|uniref:Rhodanese-like domain-containing protein n=1 Tax=Spongiivirga citrea TaxID=1481457 RepID=A0A6M0CJS9_9FLAO|nr:rhodanese-like domain-containing protein [Spongiivirga citrea]NER18198.1 rhodanese-like domain-containing protein [Spongiivirga citrea]
MKNFLSIALFLFVIVGNAQSLDSLLQKLNKQNVPYMTIDSLAKNQDAILLDAREESEFLVSRIENAVYVGYDQFNLRKTKKSLVDKDQKIVVYCSLGVRSEHIAYKLKKAGYTNVYNLYGGIFEWKNKGNPIYNNQKLKTDSIHVFSKEWGQYAKKGIPVY